MYSIPRCLNCATECSGPGKAETPALGQQLRNEAELTHALQPQPVRSVLSYPKARFRFARSSLHPSWAVLGVLWVH